MTLSLSTISVIDLVRYNYDAPAFPVYLSRFDIRDVMLMICALFLKQESSRRSFLPGSTIKGSPGTAFPHILNKRVLGFYVSEADVDEVAIPNNILSREGDVARSSC